LHGDARTAKEFDCANAGPLRVRRAKRQRQQSYEVKYLIAIVYMTGLGYNVLVTRGAIIAIRNTTGLRVSHAPAAVESAHAVTSVNGKSSLLSE
jgi:hypothetical protein